MRRGLVALGMCVALSSCGAVADGKLADREVARFHAALDAGRFGQLYEAGRDDLKKAAPELEFVKLLGAVHRKLGAVVSSERTGMSTFSGTSGSTVTLVYKTQFQNGSASEQFAYRGVGDSLELVGYNINSNALITG